MKLLILLMLMGFSTQAYSNCSDDFNTGLSEYGFAAKYFQKGLTAYQTAVDLSRQGSSDFQRICNLLVDSVTGFNVSQDSYMNCATSFESAATSCSADDSRQASANKDVCIGNEDIASDNHGVLRTLLKNTCFKKTTKQLEFVNLGSTEPLTYE